MSGRRPRVFVVLNVFLPDTLGGAAVYTDLCFSLAQAGFDVTVGAPVPFYPEWRDKSGRNGVRVWRYTESNTAIERYGLFIPRNPNALSQRLLFEFTFFLSLLRALPGMRRADVILAFCPLTAGVAVAAVARRLFGTPLVLNVQDIAADAAASVGIVRTPGVIRLLGAVERFLFNQADRWTTISPVMVRRLEALRTRGQQIDYIPNWVGSTLARDLQIAERAGRTGRAHVPVRLLYAGNIGLKQNLVALLEALRGSTLDFTFRICGEGAVAAVVAGWVAQQKDPRFSFEPLLSERDFARALTWSDYYVITQTANVGGSFIPSKLLPALMCGTPVIAVCDGDSPLGEEMHVAEPGLHLSWQEMADIGVRVGAVTPEVYARWASNARRRAAAYDRTALIDKISTLLKAAVQGRGR